MAKASIIRWRALITADTSTHSLPYFGIEKHGFPPVGRIKIHTRLRRLEYYSDPFPRFVVALEFTEVESQ